MVAQIKQKMKPHRDNLLIIFTKFPEPGFSKTRLIPSIGPFNAANLQKLMTEFVVKQARKLNISFEIRYTGADLSKMKCWLGEDLVYKKQSEGSLGERLKNAFEDGFNNGYKKIVAVGSDCPDLRADTIAMAFEYLENSRCVIGPAKDGGYYLIGLSEMKEDIFTGISWGSSKVLSETISRLKQYILLPKLADVDEFEGIPLRISVIIPVLNEETNLDRIINEILEAFNVEIIVADGGSSDRSLEIAEKYNVKIVRCEKAQRAFQMNKGAENSTGDILFFLHADSYLPENWDVAVRNTLKGKDVIFGHFIFGIKEDFRGRWLIELGTNFRAKILKKPYGDQVFFIKREDFFMSGKFPDVPILEDVLFVKNVKKYGKISCCNSVVKTSGRRWQKYGALKVVYLNQCVLIASKIGYDLNFIRKSYIKGLNPLFSFKNRKMF